MAKRKMGAPWTTDADDFLRSKHQPGVTATEVLKLFRAQFPRSGRSDAAVRSHLEKLKAQDKAPGLVQQIAPAPRKRGRPPKVAIATAAQAPERGLLLPREALEQLDAQTAARLAASAQCSAALEKLPAAEVKHVLDALWLLYRGRLPL